MSYKWDVSMGDGDDGRVTEVVMLPFRSDLSKEIITKTLTKTLQTITSQPGSISTHHNAIIESPNTHEIHTKWVSLDAHQRFISSDIYKSFYQEVLQVLEECKEIEMFHFRTSFGWKRDEEMIKSGIEGPTMQIATFYCGDGEGKGAFVGKVREFAASLGAEGAEGCLGGCVGRVLESIKPIKWLYDSGEKNEEKEEEKKGYPEVVMLVIFWTDLDAHERFKETEAFKKIVGILNGYDEYDVHHVQFLEFPQSKTNE